MRCIESSNTQTSRQPKLQRVWIRGRSRIFLGGGSLVSCSTSTPINHIVFFWQNTSCFRKPQVISGGWGVRTPCTLPLDPPLLISGETLNGVFDIASQIITNSHRNSKIKFAKLVLSCQPVLWNTVYGTSVVDSHVFMFDMTGNKSCKLLKKEDCKQKECAK